MFLLHNQNKREVGRKRGWEWRWEVKNISSLAKKTRSIKGRSWKEQGLSGPKHVELSMKRHQWNWPIGKYWKMREKLLERGSYKAWWEEATRNYQQANCLDKQESVASTAVPVGREKRAQDCLGYFTKYSLNFPRKEQQVTLNQYSNIPISKRYKHANHLLRNSTFKFRSSHQTQ